MDNFPCGGKSSEGEFSRENLTLGVFARNFVQNSSYVLLFKSQLSCPGQIFTQIELFRE